MAVRIGRTIKGTVGLPVKANTVMKVSIAPSWKTTMQVILPLLRSGNKMHREVAEEQLVRCAELADRFVKISQAFNER